MRSSTGRGPATGASSPSEVAPGLFVGGWDDAAAFRGRRLCVRDDLPEADFPIDAHVPVVDPRTGRPIRQNLDRVAALVEAARKKNEPVLLFCGYGVRRGPLAAAWYLHRADGITLDEAYERVRAARPRAEHVRQWADHWQDLLEKVTRSRSR
ncbi:MAG: dual specificity protein phosphatase family protein [Thermoplasmata archaeon]